MKSYLLIPVFAFLVGCGNADSSYEAQKSDTQAVADSSGDTQSDTNTSVEILTVTGKLVRVPQTKSLGSWLGREFFVDGTVIQPSEQVPHDVLLRHVGRTVTITGFWSEGEVWDEDDHDPRLAVPDDPPRNENGDVIRGEGLRVLSMQLVDEEVTVTGILKHHAFKTLEAWRGNAYEIGHTAILSTDEIPREKLREFIGKKVTVAGFWDPGIQWQPSHDPESQRPVFSSIKEDGTIVEDDHSPVTRFKGLRATSIQAVNE